ncbi:MAG TPA: metalloregulator ArsR/SmtB family transcription factor, partial [Streptosporangiaceae bacterium]|nr:metalloregulator ArsR/SmtB family transcription factor [Streptosporangiaceae bacterium]
LYEQFARVGKAMASPRRLELLDLLAQGERSVEELAAAAGLGLSSCSAHLQVLHHARLVSTRKRGTHVFYSLASDDVARLYAGVRDTAAALLTEVAPARDAYLGGNVEEVTRDELLRRLGAGDVTVLDVRPAAEFAAGHIPGAISIPIDQLAQRLAELPAGAEIVAYCRGPYCVFAHDAVRLLRADRRPARRLIGGLPEWRLAGLPVAAGEDVQPART